jgi:beta-hydroxylase
MKKTKPRLYKVVKYSLNTTLLALFYLMLHGIYQVVASVV